MTLKGDVKGGAYKNIPVLLSLNVLSTQYCFSNLLDLSDKDLGGCWEEIGLLRSLSGLPTMTSTLVVSGDSSLIKDLKA